MQVKCHKIIPSEPDLVTDDGLTKLFCRLKGIGEKKAAVFVKACREKSIDPLGAAIADVCLVGVKEIDADDETKKLEKMVKSYEHLVYLLGIGLTDNQANKVYDHYEDKSTEVISQNPYNIMGVISGIGFLIADSIALKAGVTAGNPSRTQACIRYCLTDSKTNGGNTYIRGWELTKLVASQLRESAIKARADGIDEIPDAEAVRSQVYLLEQSGKVIIEGAKVYDRFLRDSEQTILDSLVM